MGWLKEKRKSLMRRIRGEYYYAEGGNIVYDEDRGGIRHQYSFSPVEKARAEHLRVNSFGTDSVIRYHLMNYDENADYAWLFLVEDTIHELIHWALDREENSSTREDPQEHSIKWKEVIYPELVYVHDGDIEIDYERKS